MSRARPSGTRVVVVGGGTAGSVVAAQLSACPSLEVVLVEAGDDREHDLDANQFRAVTRRGARWPDLAFRQGSADTTYRRGLGIGGSASINGSLVTVPDLREFLTWERATGDPYWGPGAVGQTFDCLTRRTTVVGEEAWGRADRALVNAVTHRPGSRCAPAQLALDPSAGARHNVGFEALTRARSRENLTILPGCEVRALTVETGGDGVRRVTGVRLHDSTELAADHTVLCAGAIGSPAILLRSGIDRPGVGANLSNHLAVTTTWEFSDPATDDAPVTSVIIETDRLVRMVPLNTVSIRSEDARYGAIITSPLRTVGRRGRVSLTGSGEPAISFPVDVGDRRRLGHALRIAVEVAVAALESGDAAAAFVDDRGTTAEELRQSNAKDLEQWALSHPAPLYHATGTCRMGTPDDPLAVVGPDCSVIGLDGMSVIDASVFPTLPGVGPNLTVAMVALRASARLTALLAPDRQPQ